MGLFSRLLHLQSATPMEDFFTEIVAHLLRESEDLLFSLLISLDIPFDKEKVEYRISTQTLYAEGRPDILIELYTDDAEDWIFIESKLGSQEGYQQLRRYTQVLAKQTHVRNRVLVYITRDYDPKDAAEILVDASPCKVIFQQRRWHEFYRLLQAQRDNPLINEACTFMEEKRMAQTNQFSPTDILAMARLPQVFSLMDETLFGEVSERFNSVVGNVSTPRRTRHQLRHKRYMLTGSFSRNYMCFLGYWFDGGEYPALGLMLELRPSASSEEASNILSFFRNMTEQGNWKGNNLNKPKNWSKILRQRPLNEFLVTEDHVAEIKLYFISLLKDLELLSRQFDHLPWKGGGMIIVDDEDD